MKEVYIEKYVKQYGAGKITLKEIAEKEKVSVSTISKRMNEYYKEKGMEKPNILSKRRKKQIEIEKYIKDYEEQKITPWQISIKENVGDTLVKRRIKEYYEEKGIERPRFTPGARIRKKVEIERYIQDYEAGKVTIKEIAIKEKVSASIISKKINEYYQQKGLKKPNILLKRRKKQIEIEKYIQDYEARKITIKEITMKENVSITTIQTRIKEYYQQKGIRTIIKKQNETKTKKKEQISKNAIDAIKVFLKRGLTKDEIRESAGRRNIVIPDELFEQLSKEINDEKNEREK